MADRDLLIKLPGVPEKPLPGNRRANAALVVSVISVVFVGSQSWQAYQTRKLVQRSEAPYIEVVKEEIVSPGSLMMTVHNIGHTTAFNLRSDGEVYIGEIYGTAAEFVRVPSMYVMAIGSLMSNLPVGHDAQVGAYIPAQMMLEKSPIKYDAQKVMELRGRITYKDDDGNLYQTDYCYQVHEPYGPTPPAASRCFHVYDNFQKDLADISNRCCLWITLSTVMPIKLVPRKKHVIPAFEGEAAEAGWWERNRAVVETGLRAAMREGKAVSLEGVFAGQRRKRRTDAADTFVWTG